MSQFTHENKHICIHGRSLTLETRIHVTNTSQTRKKRVTYGWRNIRVRKRMMVEISVNIGSATIDTTRQCGRPRLRRVRSMGMKTNLLPVVKLTPAPRRSQVATRQRKREPFGLKRRSPMTHLPSCIGYDGLVSLSDAFGFED